MEIPKSIKFALPVFRSWLVANTILWALLAGGEGWSFGLPIIFLASFLAARLQVRAWQFRLRYLPFFLMFFLRAGLNGAVDVARRSVHPSLPIAPAWVRYRFTVTDPRVRLMTSAIVGLFPGTLASKIENDEMHVHVLDSTADWRSTVTELESRLALLMWPRHGRG